MTLLTPFGKTPMKEERVLQAKRFLQAVVFQSRARQAAGVGLSGRRLDEPASPGGCGLGAEAAVQLDLTPEAEGIFKTLWPRPVAPTEIERLQRVMTNWVERQDAVDRKRNHYLRDFRQKHGFDRREYSPELAREFEEGLERVNAEADERLRQAAEELLGDDSFDAS